MSDYYTSCYAISNILDYTVLYWGPKQRPPTVDDMKLACPLIPETWALWLYSLQRAMRAFYHQQYGSFRKSGAPTEIQIKGLLLQGQPQAGPPSNRNNKRFCSRIRGPYYQGAAALKAKAAPSPGDAPLCLDSHPGSYGQHGVFQKPAGPKIDPPIYTVTRIVRTPKKALIFGSPTLWIGGVSTYRDPLIWLRGYMGGASTGPTWRLT